MVKITIVILSTVFIAALSQRSCNVEDKSDPCKRFNSRDIPYLDSRHPSIQYSSKTSDVNKFCDLYALDDGIWYVSDFNITGKCVEQESCGSRLPIWLNGTVPSVAEEAVNRSACLRSFDDCCAKSYKLMIKNCVYYNVYCFWNLPQDCPERYCFDVDLSRVTTPRPTTTSTTTTTKRPSSKQASSASTESANTIRKTHDNDERNTVIGLTSVIIVLAVAVVVLAGYIVILKKDKNAAVTPDKFCGEKKVVF